MTDTPMLHDPVRMERWLRIVAAQVYAEGDSPMHKQITERVVQEYVAPLGLPLDAAIYDLGCGPGYFLDFMKERGFTRLTGVTLSEEDLALVRSHGHQALRADISFLDIPDGAADFLFVRHSLEHSPFPFLTLLEHNRVLRDGGRAYVEVPAPNCPRLHERNPNHYSVLGFAQWYALMERAGFEVEKAQDFRFQMTSGNQPPVDETYFMMVIRKVRPLADLEAPRKA